MNEHNRITQTLKAAIQYERGKHETTNLLNHKKEDLSFMIDMIGEMCKDLKHTISFNEQTILNSEDMSETIEESLRQRIAIAKDKLESLLAWKIIFLDAWSNGGK